MKLRPEMKKFVNEAERVMRENDLEKGDSWKTMALGDLDGMMVDKMDKYKLTTDRKKLVHISNFCMMLWNRMEGFGDKL